jgi:protein ImuA
MAQSLLNVEAIHPDLWRASLGSAHGRTVASGHASLNKELPGRGWPTGALTEVIVSQAGCGELRLLKPALAAVASRPLFVLQPPARRTA